MTAPEPISLTSYNIEFGFIICSKTSYCTRAVYLYIPNNMNYRITSIYIHIINM